MEFNLIPYGVVRFSRKKESFEIFRDRLNYSTTKTSRCGPGQDYLVTLEPLLSDTGATNDFSKYARDMSIDLIFGDSELAENFKARSSFFAPVTTQLTLTSANSGKFVIKTEKGIGFPEPGPDILKQLYKLQEILPPNSVEFSLSLVEFHNVEKQYNKLDFNWEGLKLTKEAGSGAVSLEVKDIQFPEAIWWEEWSARKVQFTGYLKSFKLKLDFAGLSELYKKRFGKDPSATVVGNAADMVILVGGNKDKEKGIQCHRSILSETSPVFEAMFQAGMLEASEGILEIVDFSKTCVRALVNFAYRRNVGKALKSCEMALELLEMADKYQMMELRDILIQIIWCMPFAWFSVDMVIKLVCYAKSAGEDLAEAEKKGWKVLNWFAEKYPEKVMESKEIENLCENPRDVVQLLVELLSGSKIEECSFFGRR